jgi:hypothetical protein
MKFQYSAHAHHGKFIEVFTDKDVLYSGLLAKYLAAFFRMSRSSVTRFSSAFSLAISAWSSDDLISLGLP